MASSVQEGGRAQDICTTPVDMSRRMIRVTGWRSGFVEFEFTLGDPLLTVELVMPPAAFTAFCAQQHATVALPDAIARRIATASSSSPTGPGPDVASARNNPPERRGMQ